jgi:hypothetical protein
MAPSGVFEDTPAWEAGLRVHEAENKWLLRETLAVLSASKCYAKSLSGAPTAFDLGVDSLGGVLGALTSASAGAALAVGMEGMGFDGDAGGHHASAEANFAAALERVGHHGVSADDEEMSAPMAAAIGAPLLTPIADTLRAVGMLRESLGRRVHRALVGNLQAFIDEDIGSVTLMREKYEIEKAACDAARAKHLAQSSSSKGPGASQARVSAARDLAAAKESLDVARARLSLAQIALEGRRRYVLLEAARQTTAELRRFFRRGVVGAGRRRPRAAGHGGVRDGVARAGGDEDGERRQAHAARVRRPRGRHGARRSAARRRGRRPREG